MTTPPSESTDQDENAVGGASGVDRITDNYRTILNELSLLATVSVLLFGFLLSVAARDATTTERWLLLTALICVSSSTLIFILPVAYHRLEFPYEDWNKFQRRSHYFITVGVPIFVAGVYLSMTVAVWDLLDGAGFVVSGVPMAFSGAVFLWRRRLSRLLA
jgi:hypothetical protein